MAQPNASVHARKGFYLGSQFSQEAQWDAAVSTLEFLAFDSESAFPDDAGQALEVPGYKVEMKSKPK